MYGPLELHQDPAEAERTDGVETKIEEWYQDSSDHDLLSATFPKMQLRANKDL
jgi:hypothetical protein